MIFFLKRKLEIDCPQDLSIGNFNEYLDIPHTVELVDFY